ncbi:MAG: AMP-binding protein [Muribaculaceae bacterium]|nr:AMP-binding protein [Muribaculaceae bacterium]
MKPVFNNNTYRELKKSWFDSSDSILCHSSGSTGIPKRIYIPKKEMTASALRTCEFFNINASSHLHSCISPDYIGGKMMLIRSIVSGANFTYEPPSSRPLGDIQDDYIDLVSVVPTQMIHILEHPEIWNSIGNYLIGGAAIHPNIRKNIIDKGIKAFESYGMTETASHIALREVKDGEDWFRTLPGISVFPHTENRLGIRIEGWKDFLTNDIAEINSENSFRILGRADNVINTGGKKVFPESIEQKLNAYLDFSFYITSRQDEKWGESVVLVTTPWNIENVSEEKIFEICRATLVPWEVPKEIIRVEHFELTGNGKIKRDKF